VSGDADASKIPSFGLSTAESARHSTRPYSIVWAVTRLITATYAPAPSKAGLKSRYPGRSVPSSNHRWLRWLRRPHKLADLVNQLLPETQNRLPLLSLLGLLHAEVCSNPVLQPHQRPFVGQCGPISLGRPNFWAGGDRPNSDPPIALVLEMKTSWRP
jgi:hypothetical protein